MPDVVHLEPLSGGKDAASGIAAITLDRPDKLNAIDGALMDGVDAALDELMDTAVRKAREIAANNAYGVWQTKTGQNTALDAPSLRHAKEIENRTQVLSTFTGNAAEAAMAHREKHPPVWNEL